MSQELQTPETNKARPRNVAIQVLLVLMLAVVIAGAWYIGRNQDQLVDKTIVVAKGKVDHTIEQAKDRKDLAVAQVKQAEYQVEDKLAAKLNERVEARSQETKIAFELPTQQSRELRPDVTLRIESTDPDRRRFDGFLMLKGRKLPLDSHEANVPYVIYPGGGREPMQLVVEEVHTGEVKGYLLAPRS
jgi:hypothetical protein